MNQDGTNTLFTRVFMMKRQGRLKEGGDREEGEEERSPELL
jgi:hypothetical protein